MSTCSMCTSNVHENKHAHVFCTVRAIHTNSYIFDKVWRYLRASRWGEVVTECCHYRGENPVSKMNNKDDIIHLDPSTTDRIIIIVILIYLMRAVSLVRAWVGEDRSSSGREGSSGRPFSSWNQSTCKVG